MASGELLQAIDRDEVEAALRSREVGGKAASDCANPSKIIAFCHRALSQQPALWRPKRVQKQALARETVRTPPSPPLPHFEPKSLDSSLKRATEGHYSPDSPQVGSQSGPISMSCTQLKWRSWPRNHPARRPSAEPNDWQRPTWRSGRVRSVTHHQRLKAMRRKAAGDTKSLLRE